jgi:hypothetical protein
VRKAAVFDEGAKKHTQGEDEYQRMAGEQQNNSPPDKKTEEQKNENRERKFHGRDGIDFSRIGKRRLRF